MSEAIYAHEWVQCITVMNQSDTILRGTIKKSWFDCDDNSIPHFEVSSTLTHNFFFNAESFSINDGKYKDIVLDWISTDSSAIEGFKKRIVPNIEKFKLERKNSKFFE